MAGEGCTMLPKTGGGTMGLISVKRAAEILQVSRRQVQRLAGNHADDMGAQRVDNGDDGVWVFEESKLRKFATDTPRIRGKHLK